MNRASRKKVVVLLSGGLDSTCLLYEVRRRWRPVLGLSFDYGAKHNGREIPLAALHCHKLNIPHEVIPLPFIRDRFVSSLLVSGGPVPNGPYSAKNMHSTVVPFRNGIMISVAAGLAESIGADAVAIAAHAADHPIYLDCRPAFMSAMRRAIRFGTYARVELLCPFLNMDKAEIAARGAKLGVDFAATWSCYKGGRKHCGTCGTCRERKAAFARAGVADPTEYEL